MCVCTEAFSKFAQGIEEDTKAADRGVLALAELVRELNNPGLQMNQKNIHIYSCIK